MNKLPEGWTDDMTIVVPTGRSLDDIVDYVLRATIRRETPDNMVRHLVEEFGLTQSDAELAWDRTCGEELFALRRDTKRTVRQKTKSRWRG